MTSSLSAPSGAATGGPTALALLDHLSDMVFVVDARGTLCYANSACEAFLGRSVEDVLGTNALELVHVDDRGLAIEALAETAAKGPGIREPLTVRVAMKDANAPDEPMRMIELVANNLLDTPEVRGIVICARDVTGRAETPSGRDDSDFGAEFSFDRAPSACAVIDPDGRLTRVNPAMIELTGYTAAQLIGMHVAELAHPEELDEEATTAQRLLDGDADHDTHERRLQCADGHAVWVRRTFWVVRGPGNSVHAVNCALVDISEQRAVKEHALQLRDILESSPELVFLTDAHGTIEYVNTRARELLGLQEGDRPSDRLDGFLGAETVERIPEKIEPQLLANGMWTGELTLLTTTGEEIPAACTVQLHKDEHDVVTLVSAIAHDIRDLKSAQRRLEHQATHDVLTMLPNRQLFQELGDQALARADRDGTTVAVLFLDLDRFKHVNDSFGHPVGDQLLVEVAARLRDVVRKSDVLARFGGDEFAICCEHPAGQREMLELAARLIAAVSPPAQLGTATAEVGVSIGIAIGAGSRVTIDTLLRDADVALYQAKEQGRGRAVIFGISTPTELL
ncbi:MAG: diguanylate cyclase [Acidimicrobiia bacterium]